MQWQHVVKAIDLIRGVQGEVVLLTRETPRPGGQ